MACPPLTLCNAWNFSPNASLYTCICFLDSLCKSADFFYLKTPPLKKGTRTVFSEGFQEVEPEPAIKCDCFTALNIALSPLTTLLACFQLLELHKFSLASGPLHMPFLRPIGPPSPPLLFLCQTKSFNLILATISLQRASWSSFWGG